MSVLSQKLQEAAKQYQSQNFKQSLQAYQDCIKFCHRTHQDKSIILNIMSTKASLQYVLGEYDEALATLNSVLSKDCSHFLALLHRSQVYKSKNKLRKARKDLEQIFAFRPGNLEVSTLKAQIEELLIKQGKGDVLSSESEQQNQQTQQNTLKFMNLKNIDRKSSQFSKRSERKSRVTILGDHTFEYKVEEVDEIVEEQQQNNVDKALRTEKEIESDTIIEGIQPIIKVTAPKKTKKSILKNKGNSIFIQSEDIEQKQSKYLGRQSKLINMVKNIDGKVIPADHHTQTANKQVEFRKSVSDVPLQQLLLIYGKDQFQEVPSKISNHSFNLGNPNKRKSCLKRSSFDFESKVQRRSKFEDIDKIRIDGKVLKNPKRRSIQQAQIVRDHIEQNHSDNQGSQHNIFGSKEIFVSQDLKIRLGLIQSQSEPQPKKTQQQSKAFKVKPKHSILKKNSSIIVQKKVSLKQSKFLGGNSLRQKKSVMFNCTL